MDQSWEKNHSIISNLPPLHSLHDQHKTPYIWKFLSFLVLNPSACLPTCRAACNHNIFPKIDFYFIPKQIHHIFQTKTLLLLPYPSHHFSIDVSLISRLPEKITSITQLNCLLCPCCTHVPENLILCHQKSQALHLYTRLSFVKHKQLINHDCCQRLKNITSKDKTPLINATSICYKSNMCPMRCTVLLKVGWQAQLKTLYLKPSRIVYWDSRIIYQGSRHSKNFTRIVIHSFEETI